MNRSCSSLRVARLLSSVLVGVAALASPTAFALNLTVNTLQDSVDIAPGDGLCRDSAGRCSLRAAVQESNALPGTDSLSLPVGRLQLALPGTAEQAAHSGDLDVTGVLQIQGAGADRTEIDGALLDTLFEVHDGSDLSLVALTLRNGRAPPVSPVDGPAASGIRLRGNANLSLLAVRWTGIFAPVTPDADSAPLILTDPGSRLLSHEMELDAVSTGTQADLLIVVTQGQARFRALQGTAVLPSRLSILAIGGELICQDCRLDGFGIAVAEAASLRLERSVLDGRARSGVLSGLLTVLGQARVEHSTLAFSSGLNPAVGLAGSTADLVMVNSSIIHNAGPNGSALSVDAGTAQIFSSTIADNLATRASGQPRALDGAIKITGSAEVSLVNTVLVNRAEASAPGNAGGIANCAGTLRSGDGNAFGALEGCERVSESGLLDDRVGVQLDGLFVPAAMAADPPLPIPRRESVLIDAGHEQGCFSDQSFLVLDQRGEAREVDGDGDGFVQCDIGAIEFRTQDDPLLPLFSDGFEEQ